MDTNISFREGKCCALIWNTCWIWQDSSLNAVLRVSRCLRPSVKKKIPVIFKELLPEYHVNCELDEGMAVLFHSIDRMIAQKSYEGKRWYHALIIDCGEERQISHPEDSALIITVFPILSVLRRVMKTEIPISEEITLPTAFCSY